VVLNGQTHGCAPQKLEPRPSAAYVTLLHPVQPGQPLFLNVLIRDEFKAHEVLTRDSCSSNQERTHMDIQGIMAQLRQEASRIEHAISALTGLGSQGTRRGRSPKASQAKPGGLYLLLFLAAAPSTLTCHGSTQPTAY
jgi:hypothetical protein